MGVGGQGVRRGVEGVYEPGLIRGSEVERRAGGGGTGTTLLMGDGTLFS